MSDSSVFKQFKSQLKWYKMYEPFSFLNGSKRTIENLTAAATATGLLQDMAALTAELTTEQRKQKEYTREVFCVYCLHLCSEVVEKWRGNPEDNAEKLIEILFKFPTRRDENKEKYTVVEEDWTKQPGLINELTNRLKKGGINGFHAEIKKCVSSRCKDIWRQTQIEKKVKDPVTGKVKREYTPKMQKVKLESVNSESGEYYDNPELSKAITAMAQCAMDTEMLIVAVNEALEECYKSGKITYEQYEIVCLKYGINDYSDGMTLTEAAKKMDKDYQHIRRECLKAEKLIGDYLREKEIFN